MCDFCVTQGSTSKVCHMSKRLICNHEKWFMENWREQFCSFGNPAAMFEGQFTVSLTKRIKRKVYSNIHLVILKKTQHKQKRLPIHCP